MPVTSYEAVLFQLQHRQTFCTRQAVLASNASRKAHDDAVVAYIMWMERGRAHDKLEAITAQRLAATLHADYCRWLMEANGLGELLVQVRHA